MASTESGSQGPPILGLDSHTSQIIGQTMAVAHAFGGWNQVREAYPLLHDPERFLAQMNLPQKSREILSGTSCQPQAILIIALEIQTVRRYRLTT